MRKSVWCGVTIEIALEGYKKVDEIEKEMCSNQKEQYKQRSNGVK